MQPPPPPLPQPTKRDVVNWPVDLPMPPAPTQTLAQAAPASQIPHKFAAVKSKPAPALQEPAPAEDFKMEVTRPKVRTHKETMDRRTKELLQKLDVLKARESQEQRAGFYALPENFLLECIDRAEDVQQGLRLAFDDDSDDCDELFEQIPQVQDLYTGERLELHLV